MTDGATDIKAGDTARSAGAHPEIPAERAGVLLVNLGTPDAPTPAAVRRYLREFLSDRRIIDLPRALWLPILYGIVLNVRPGPTARNYATIWRKESNESPLRYFTRGQSAGLAAALGETVVVDWAMRYGAPSIASRLNGLVEQGCRRILVVPLYPQYSATTTASVADAVFDAVKSMRWQPSISIAPPFHDAPAYINALASLARRRLDAIDWAPERVVLSFHGLPERYFKAGDPYYCHCAKTARLLREAMGWTEEFAPLAFQSKFGPEKWLEPPTEGVIVRAAESGVKGLAVMTPGFVSDCIETLEEIGIQARETFMKAGGEQFDLIPCLNDSPEMITLLETLVRREASGWVSAPAG